jgi:hypothetical protein
MNFESALKGSAISFAVWSVLFGLSNSLGYRIVEAIGWVTGWLLFSLVIQTIKERQ